MTRHVTVEADTWAEETFEVQRRGGENYGLGYEALGGYLRSLRERRGHSIREVAAGTGISNGYISQIETGAKQVVPSLKVLTPLADFYGIELNTLLFVGGLSPKFLGLNGTIKGPTDVDDTFRMLVLHPLLQGAKIGQEDLPWVATRVKTMWLRHSKELIKHLRTHPTDAYELLAVFDAKLIESEAELAASSPVVQSIVAGLRAGAHEQVENAKKEVRRQDRDTGTK